MTPEIEQKDRAMILTHYYRAMVGRADVWRMRMDTTTNWAIGATAAVISFALGNDGVPHYVVCIAILMTLAFLQLEARRLTFYHLWQQRVLLMENGLLRPALSLEPVVEPRGEGDLDSPPLDLGHDPGSKPGSLARALDVHLGQTIPSMSRTKAMARRLRRVYLYLFGVQILAWGFKLSNHPEPASSLGDLVDRAHIGIVPGALVWSLTGVVFLAGAVLAWRQGGVDRDPA